jgi:hypothetical protein
LQLDGGLLVGLPAALDTGITTGLAAGVTWGRRLAWIARLSWSSATEYATAWTITQDELRLRAGGAIHRAAGRGNIGLRLGAGATLVHETRARDQAMRAGLVGSQAEQTATSLLPAVDVEGVVRLRVIRGFGVSVSGGPSLHWISGSVHAGWVGQLGVAWGP